MQHMHIGAIISYNDICLKIFLTALLPGRLAQRALAGHGLLRRHLEDLQRGDGAHRSSRSTPFRAAENSLKQSWEVCSGHRGSIKSSCFSTDSRTLATGSEDCSVKLWKVLARSGELTLQGHGAPVSAICFSHHGKAGSSSSWTQLKERDMEELIPRKQRHTHT